MLTDKANYLTAGIHIGMKSCTKYMKNFVYKTREDGLSVFNLQEVDARLEMASLFLSKYKKIMVVGHKTSAQKPVVRFSKEIKAKPVTGRFSPGTLTNPSYKDFFEPDAILVTDPVVDMQAIKESKKKRIPIVAFCDTFNTPEDVDLVIPLNNNGRNSIAFALWVMAREIKKKRGDLKNDSEYKPSLTDFGYEKGKKEYAPKSEDSSSESA